MYRVLFLLLSLLPLSAKPAAQLLPWDGLPTVEVRFLAGSYAGKTDCPMCMHGYDAGVLWFVAQADVGNAEARITALRSALQTINDPRFRVFIVLASASGDSVQLSQSLRELPPGWHVARLEGDALHAAEQEFGLALETQSHAFWFAQRRLLAQETAPTNVQRNAGYALAFLSEHYAKPNLSLDPDSPKGQLWLAPQRLSNTLNLDSSPARRLCFQGRDGPAAGALASVMSSNPPRGAWARTDAQGCVLWQGRDFAGFVLDQLYEVSARVRWDASQGTILPLERHTVGARQLVVEPILGPCENCELIYQAMPSRLSNLSATPNADGEALHLSGTVRDAAGTPKANVVVYIYHTDVHGNYPGASATQPHGQLRAWARTDAQGHYGFDAIRPASYPARAGQTRQPAHIHMHLLEPGRCSYYLADVLFSDDPLLSKTRRAAALMNARGGRGLQRPTRDASGVWQIKRDIVVGLNIPNYSECGKQ